MATAPTDKVTHMPKSLKACKGHFTRALTAVDRLYQAITLHQESPPELVIKGAFEQVECTQSLVINLLQQLYDLDPDDVYLVGLGETSSKSGEAFAKLKRQRISLHERRHHSNHKSYNSLQTAPIDQPQPEQWSAFTKLCASRLPVR